MFAARRWLMCVAWLGVVALALGACSEPTPGAKVQRETASPGPASSSPSSTKLTAEQEVEAAVRNYYAELTRAAQTNDTTKLKTLMAKSCPCYGAARSIDETASSGRKIPGAAWMVQEVDVHDLIEGSAAAEVKYEVSAYDVFDAKGNKIDHFPKRQSHLDLSLVRTRSRWILTNVFDLES